MYTKVTIGGYDVSAYLRGWDSEKTFGQQIGDINIRVAKTVVNTVDIINGMEVKVYRGLVTATDKLVFWGYVEDVDKGEKGGTEWKIYAKDKLSLAKRGEKTYSYDQAIDDEAGVASAIWSDLMSPFDFSTSVVSTGTINVLAKFVCNHADPYERGEELCKIYDYQQFYRADTDTAYFQPKGYTNNSLVLQVGQNIVGVPKWNYNFAECQNFITVIGGEQIVETTESKTGTGSQTSFTLAHTPKSVKVYVDGVLKVGGVEEATEDYDYTVDAELRQVIFVNAPANAAQITIDYSYPLTIATSSKDSVSIARYCDDDEDKAYKKTYFKLDILTVEDARNFIKKQLSTYAYPFVTTSIPLTADTDTLALEPGQTLRVVDSVNDEDRYVMITKIRIGWPHKADVLEVGDRIWKTSDWQNNTLDRVRRLEEELGKNQEILVQVFPLDRSINFVRRYFKMQQNGTDIIVTQGGKIYQEFLYDNDFIDTTLTTATVNNTTKEVAF